MVHLLKEPLPGKGDRGGDCGEEKIPETAQMGEDGVKLRSQSARGLCVTAHPVHHL